MIREELKNLAPVARGDGNVNLYIGGYNVALACAPKYAPDIIRAVRSHNEMVEALEAAERLIREALPKFNWGASALDANAIRLLNEVPATVRAALAAAKGG